MRTNNHKQNGFAAAVAGALMLITSSTQAAPGDTELVSVSIPSAAAGFSANTTQAVSADGRYAVFESSAANVVSGDTNNRRDVFVVDRQTGGVSRVSVDSNGAQANSDSFYPSISADGRYVAFHSSASNLVAGDANGSQDVFVRDLQSGTTTLVSVADGGGAGNNSSYYPSISADGRYVAFWSYASNLVAGDTNNRPDVFMRDVQSDTTTLVSVADGGGAGNFDSYYPSISADGRYVAFWSYASNLVAGDTNGRTDVFLHEVVPSDSEPPVVSGIAANPNPAAVNTAITLTATLDDSGTGGSAISGAEYRIDNGPWVAMDAVDGAFDGPTEAVAAALSFTSPGVHEVCVRGSDAAGNVSNPGDDAENACTLVVAYDPSAGFVTGGGWIQSPAGAYVADPDLTGKASFGFVSKYKKGATIPEGNTQFTFQTGGLSFHSSSYEWLVVAGGKAQFKGTGTVNGTGNYGFLIFATDAAATSASDDMDSFRIQIWDKDNGDAIVYDNQVEQVIGGGSIVIHTGGKNK